MFECSGHPVALQSAIDTVVPGGSIQLVAISPAGSFDAMSAVAKEIQLNAKFIYVDEFADALDLLARDHIDVMSLTTTVVGLDEYQAASPLSVSRTRRSRRSSGPAPRREGQEVRAWQCSPPVWPALRC